jgi:tetratricopeptide (TPR) repeat protein
MNEEADSRKDTGPASPAPPSAPGDLPGATNAPVPPAPTTGWDHSSPLPVVGPGELPAAFGRYELRRLLGQGGMGAVYLAHDSYLDRPVALKLPRLPGEDHPQARERFLREARAAAGLRHPNICPVYDAGEIGQALYLSMAYIDGEPLSHRLHRHGALPVAEAAALAAAVARAMQEAHDRGIVHRDLKPANLMVDRRGQPVVMDFGLAQQPAAAEVRLTQSGAVVGTPAYMAPEQAQGTAEAVGPASDIYGLGVVLYEMLTGRVPFQGEAMGRLLAQIQRDPPPRPSQFRPDLQPALEAICLKALAKNPEERFASMADFAAALAPFTEAAPAGAAPRLPETAEYAPPRRRRWWLPAAAGALLLGVVLGVLRYATSGKRANDSPTGEGPAEGLAEDDPARQKLARRLAEGRLLIEAQQFDKAAAVAEQALELHPRSPGALALRGTARAGLGQREEALADCNAALKQNPETALAYRTRGILLLGQGLVDEAIADHTVAIRLEPDNHLGYTNRSGAYVSKGEPAQAVADATEALKRAPRMIQALRNRAAAHFLLGQYDNAIKDLDAVLEKDRGNANSYWVRSLAHAQKGDLTRARQDREAAEKLDGSYKGKPPPDVSPPAKPSRPKLSAADRAAIARLVEQIERAHDKGDYKSVLKPAAEVLRLDPDHPRALELRAHALVAVGQTQEGRDLATRTARLYPSSHVAYFTLGRFCGRRRQWAGEIAYYTIALRIKPDQSTTWNNRAYAYLQLGNYHQALADSHESFKHGKHAVLFANRASIYVHLGEYAKALADLDAAIDRDPVNVGYYLQRGVLHARLGHARQGRADRERAGELAGPGVTLPTINLPEPLPPPRRDPELNPAPPAEK